MSLNSPLRSFLSSDRFKTSLVVVAILTTSLAAMSSNCADPDLWGHVEYGREVLRDRSLPSTATWTFAAAGAEWVNHENIAELLLSWTVDTFGPGGLPWMKLSIATSILLMMLYSARRSGAGWWSIAIVCTLVASNIQFHWHYRPQILTYLSLALLLTLWQCIFGNLQYTNELISDLQRRIKWLWLLPLLMCFWANSHGGFAAGIAIVGVYHFMVCLQILRATTLRYRNLLIQISVITLASIAATLVNPYGTTLWKFMLDALRLPRPEIADWAPLELFGQEAVRFWCLIAVVGMSLILDRGRRELTHLVLIALLLWQGMSHCRHLSIFAIVCGFWIPRHLHHVCEIAAGSLRRMQPATISSSTTMQSRPRLASSIVMSLLVIVNVLRIAPDLQPVHVERAEYPISAMQFMHDQQLTGNVVVTFNWAQYAIGCFAATDASSGQSRVAVDGRFETCYPREITDIYFDFWLGTADPKQRYRSPKSGDFNPARALTFGQPDLVLIARDQLPSARVMSQHQNDWTLLYQDSLAQLWGKRSKYDDSSNSSFVPPSRRQISDTPQLGTVRWPAYPVRQSLHDRMTSGSPSDAELSM